MCRRQQAAAKEIVGSGRACEGPPGTFFLLSNFFYMRRILLCKRKTRGCAYYDTASLLAE